MEEAHVDHVFRNILHEDELEESRIDAATAENIHQHANWQAWRGDAQFRAQTLRQLLSGARDSTHKEA